MTGEIRLFNKININWGSLIHHNKYYWSFDFVPIPMLYFGYHHYNKDACLGLNKNFWSVAINWLFWGISIDNDVPIEDYSDYEDWGHE